MEKYFPNSYSDNMTTLIIREFCFYWVFMIMNYILTESQLQIIVEQTSNERLEKIIREFIMSKHGVLDVTFDLDPRINKKMIKIIFDRKELTNQHMYNYALEIQSLIENLFILKLRGQGEPYELTYDAK